VPNAEPLILDNLITDVRPASRRPDLAPVFSFNSEGLWQGVGSQTAGDPTARLSRWREMLVEGARRGIPMNNNRGCGHVADPPDLAAAARALLLAFIGSVGVGIESNATRCRRSCASRTTTTPPRSRWRCRSSRATRS
jgi:hypothetical protein